MIADGVRELADSILYEGFLLYPYRKNTLKNQRPWQFGVVMPRGYDDPTEPSSIQTQVLASSDEGGEARVEVLARFLQIAGNGDPLLREVPVTVPLAGGAVFQVPFEFDRRPFEDASLTDAPQGPSIPQDDIMSAHHDNAAPNHNNKVSGTMRVDVAREGDYFRIVFEVQNETQCAAGGNRNEALPGALVAVQVLFTGSNAKFVSFFDPPADATDAIAKCHNQKLFPVLVGEMAGNGRNTANAMLAAPIILYDFPEVAPQSSSHTFDATEIDELLVLSVASMADGEKKAAAESHEWARRLLDRADALDRETQAGLHGKSVLNFGTSNFRDDTFPDGGRWSTGPQHSESIEIAGTKVQRGTRVRVHPKGRSDAFDDFVSGMEARVCEVRTDVDGQRYIGVVFDADPASDLHEWYGRSFFYGADEIEPLQVVS